MVPVMISLIGCCS